VRQPPPPTADGNYMYSPNNSTLILFIIYLEFISPVGLARPALLLRLLPAGTRAPLELTTTGCLRAGMRLLVRGVVDFLHLVVHGCCCWRGVVCVAVCVRAGGGRSVMSVTSLLRFPPPAEPV